ncbi:lipoprotein [Spiroplasma taiwanense]|uniref:Lipoprotein n=1 Tax=Spiroplasma taiwanense CT-1 TaxID=1276220 RepID=S5LU65_9MOLU|nr:lipoprotein [Spiroplasma taiwanense]AGR41289.1 hypothetical protein STAIW_v1c06710 [Spiroplasma taiwanense CT-1]
MKKLLGLLAATGLVATTSATVVACGDKEVSAAEKLVNDVKEFISKGNDSWIEGTTTAQDIIDATFSKFVVKDGNVVKDAESLSGLKSDSLILKIGQTSKKVAELSFDIEVYATKAGTAKNEFVKNTDSVKKGVSVVKLKENDSKTPIISAIQDQNVVIGKKLEVDVTITNPVEGVELKAESATIANATVAIKENNKIEITGVAAGDSEITVSYEGATSVKFIVTVEAEAEAEAPVISPIENKTVVIGEKIEVTVEIAHPVDGVEISATSATIANATVAIKENNKIEITGVAAGDSEITVSYEGATSVKFIVTVKAEAEAEAPVISPIENKTVVAGEKIEVTVEIAHPVDGVEISATSATIANATVAIKENNKIEITGVAAGDSEITVSYTGAQDVTFTVTVTAAQ